MSKIDEHYELKHKGIEESEQELCQLCKNFVEGQNVAPAADLGVDVSLRVPLVDVFGKID